MEELKNRDQLPEADRWQLEDIFPSDQAWEAEFTQLKDGYLSVTNYKGKLNNKADIKTCLEDSDRYELMLTRLFVYARMRRDEDNSRSLYQGMTDRASMLSVEIGTAYSFITPELTMLPEEQLKALSEDADLAEHKRTFINLIRNKEHILSDAEERLLAMMGDMADACDTVFSMLNDADMRFPVIKGEDDKDVEITHGRYRLLLESKDRRVRKEAFEGMYSSYQSHINTLSATYSGSVKTDIFYSRARKHPSALEASLFSDNVPVTVYDKLIEALHDSLPVMYRYVQLRKELLGLDEMHMYDMYVPLVEEPASNVPFTDACEILKKALQPLGADYIAILEEAFRDRWVDVYENRGKTSGAYSWGVYGVHPYVLLNYQGKFDDVFTLAHEMGHAIHSYKSNKTQPYAMAGYKILVAEVASTVNEVLLLRYLLAESKSKEEKLYLLNHYLEQFRTTVFRQTMFAEFEKISHAMSERSEPLTHEALSAEYARLNALYYGDAVAEDPQIALEWARIPHFYRAFYVYKYATGFSSAVAIAHRILTEGQPAVDAYMRFLSSGGSDDPLELLKITGVDLTTPQPVAECMHAFEETLDEFIRTVGK